MDTGKKINQWLMRAHLFFCLCVLPFLSLIAAPDDINLAAANLTHTYNLNVNQNPNEQIAVLNAPGNVFWEFNSIPPGATGGGISTFTFMGITVTLPAGSPASAVSSGLTVSVAGAPLAAGSFSFTLTVASDDGLMTQNRQYDVIINQPMDLVLVFDRSGSMNATTGTGDTRWTALKTAASLFGNMYKDLNRTSDRISITYFETDLVPASACCNNFIAFSNTIGTTINTDLNANAPGGSTGMGAGIKDAQSKFNDPNKAKSILLFTDGEQNQNPKVNSNGQGFSDATTITSGVKISTIGIGSPSPVYNTVLQNLAINNRGSYNITSNGAAFTFMGGLAAGDLTSGFTNQFVSMLAEFSPQLVARNTTNVGKGAAPHNLISFPLNKRVDKLILEFSFDKNFELNQLAQLMARILVQKNGASVMANVQPSWAGNYTNTILFKIDFVNPTPNGNPPIASDGNWTVQLADVAFFKVSQCRVTALADDHRLNYKTSYGTNSPRVNTPFTLKVDLDLLSYPITDATVEAIVLRPGEDLGDLLAKNNLIVNVSSAPDAASPGVQKFDQLLSSDSSFIKALALSENAVVLAHTNGGHYEGTFNGLTVSGLYTLIYRISGNHALAGTYQRMVSENFYTSFNGIDLSKSAISTQLVSGNLVMQLRPMTPYGRFLGPAAADAFTVNNPAVQISKIEDHQDGRYTITFTGNVDQPVTLAILGQDIYTGKLADISKSGGGGSIIDSLQKWLESLGLPGWSVWLLLLLILLILIFLLRKKPKNP